MGSRGGAFVVCCTQLKLVLTYWGNHSCKYYDDRVLGLDPTQRKKVVAEYKTTLKTTVNSLEQPITAGIIAPLKTGAKNCTVAPYGSMTSEGRAQLDERYFDEVTRCDESTHGKQGAAGGANSQRVVKAEHGQDNYNR
ncbi:hypothetical protein EDB92DRAFT_1820434 [Lactarius akahatsu]|uniref:Uncharacterized protein n=1 Tax=Lactarius akahatsu TaxID=416441 RepID=A0AAD4L737_9AGAM|nr:hypothetical protein EDB92DRAFT_1820434 [Lactarius akahatsu]